MKACNCFLTETTASLSICKNKAFNGLKISFLCIFILLTCLNVTHAISLVPSKKPPRSTIRLVHYNLEENISLYPLPGTGDIWLEDKPVNLELRFAADDDFPWEIFYPSIMKRKVPDEPDEPVSIPFNQFNIGDSIGEGAVASNNIEEFISNNNSIEKLLNHGVVWSTGYDTNDIVYSLNERFEDINPESYTENNETLDRKFNKAVFGAVMADFAAQANEVVAEANTTGGAGMVTVLLGNNDACSGDLGGMTDPGEFEAQFRSGLDVLAGSDATKNAVIHVSGIPAIYWLWAAKKDSFYCQYFWPQFEICPVLLMNPENDCESIESSNDPANDYPGDGENCLRRKTFYRKIRDEYNTVLRNVVEEYRSGDTLPNAYYVDIYDVIFDDSHVNDIDCFHPNTGGHKLLADEEWKRSKWNTGD